VTALYPLRFQPILRRYIWGGRRLESLGKQIGPESDYAESWEIVDRPGDQSVVLAGTLAGQSLAAIVERYNRPLLGRHAGHKQFPLLFKFLDAQERLSIQVHPDDAQAALLDPPDLGKTEAWVILDTAPHSYLYAGLRRGIDRNMLARELDRHTAELCCERIEPKAGDCYFLSPGVVHAIGPGLLVAEIQQASDTTYRLYDYDRRGPDGKARELHIEQALAVIDFAHGPVVAQRPRRTERPGAERLVECSKFVLDRLRIEDGQTVGGDDRCHILAVTEGEVALPGDPLGKPLTRGSVALLPAELGTVALQGKGAALDAYLP